MMPSHSLNELRIYNTTIEALHGVALNDDNFVDFELLLPTPLNCWQGNEGSDHEENFPGLAMRWAIDNWGTKWNAYGEGGPEGRYETVVQDGDDVLLTFQTAWHLPRGWVCALFNKTDKRITASWLSEGGVAAHVEKFWIEDNMNGRQWVANEIAEGTPEHRRLHKLLWGVEEFEDEE